MAIDDKLTAETDTEEQYSDINHSDINHNNINYGNIPINNCAEIGLNYFYSCCGISPEDNDGKRKVMSGIVHLPNWNYNNEGMPPLLMLEQQYLREKGIYH